MQHSTTPKGLETVMLKTRATIKANMYHMRQVGCNVGIRKQWETILYDQTAVDITADGSYMKVYYCYKSPKVGFVGIEDRDFIQNQHIWFDFPEKGMMTSCCYSILDERFPVMKNKTRATVHIMAIVGKADVDQKTGEDLTHCMLLVNTDINGLIPKWIVNIGARSAPA